MIGSRGGAYVIRTSITCASMASFFMTVSCVELMENTTKLFLSKEVLKDSSISKFDCRIPRVVVFQIDFTLCGRPILKLVARVCTPLGPITINNYIPCSEVTILITQ